MGILKAKAEKTDSVTREEFEALAAQLESFKTVTAVAVAAIGAAMHAAPGMPDGNSRTRLEKLAASAHLDSAEHTVLKSFLKLLDRMGRAESQREFAETQARAARTTRDIRPVSWRG